MNNKRSTPRHHIAFDVEVYYCGSYWGRSTIRDIHADGAFIEKLPDDVYKNDVLELRLLRDTERARPIRLRAMVVRSSDDGVGVLFGYGEHDFNLLLKKLFKRAYGDYSGDVMQPTISA